VGILRQKPHDGLHISLLACHRRKRAWHPALTGSSVQSRKRIRQRIRFGDGVVMCAASCQHGVDVLAESQGILSGPNHVVK
jgi:hypothetical protein